MLQPNLSMQFPKPPTAALEAEIQSKNWENERLLKDINELKTTMFSAFGSSDNIL